jgi:hypothetical protein
MVFPLVGLLRRFAPRNDTVYRQQKKHLNLLVKMLGKGDSESACLFEKQ